MLVCFIDGGDPAFCIDALHLQYIGLCPAAVPVELPDQQLYLGQAEVGEDHPVAAVQAIFLWGSVLRPLSTTNQLSFCTSKEVKNLQQQPVHSRESATARRAQERSTASTCL